MSLSEMKKKYGRKVVSTALVGSLLFSTNVMANAKAIEKDEDKQDTRVEVNTNYNVFVNGKVSNVDIQFINKNVYLPVRDVCESIGADVVWSEKVTYITKNDLQLFVMPGFNYYGIVNLDTNEKDFKEMKTEALYCNDKLYAPIELFSEFGENIYLDTVNNKVVIDKSYNADFMSGKSLKEFNLQEKRDIYFDGKLIDNGTAEFLQESNTYMAFEDENGLYIYSYQYFIDTDKNVEANNARRLIK